MVLDPQVNGDMVLEALETDEPYPIRMRLHPWPPTRSSTRLDGAPRVT